MATTSLFSRNAENDVVESDSLRVTWWAALSASVTTIGAFAVAVLDQLNALTIPDNIKIALIGLIGAGVVGWAIASSGDALARAYAAAHVTSNEDDVPKPAIQTAAAALVTAYEKAHPAAPPAGANGQGRLVPLPSVEVRVGNADAKAVLALVKEDKSVEYLVGLPGQQLDWKPSASVALRQ